MISSRKKENVSKAVETLKSEGLEKVEGMQCHVGKAADRERLVRETVAKMGGIDILVSNAAVNPTLGHTLDVSKYCEEEIIGKFSSSSVRKKHGIKSLRSTSRAHFYSPNWSFRKC